MECRGILDRPDVGYLSQLEALRYCEVGAYYKTPRNPVWVVVSTSHFTVLFSGLAALRESKYDAILERCCRDFKSAKRGEDNGFILSTKLGKGIGRPEPDGWRRGGKYQGEGAGGSAEGERHRNCSLGRLLEDGQPAAFKGDTEVCFGGVQGTATALAEVRDPDPLMITQFRYPPLIYIYI